jgi:hypothetical protein
MHCVRGVACALRGFVAAWAAFKKYQFEIYQNVSVIGKYNTNKQLVPMGEHGHRLRGRSTAQGLAVVWTLAM